MPTSQVTKFDGLRNLIKKFNIYDQNTNLSEIEQSISTGIFTSLLLLSILIVALSTGLTVQTHIVTIDYPSESIFNQLSTEYPLNLTLSCLCQQSSIIQDEIISFNPEYHPICSSEFVNATFLLSLSDRYVSDYYPLDYRLMLSSHIQFLQIFCQKIKEKVTNVLQKFSSQNFITTEVLSSKNLHAEMTTLVHQFQQNAMADYQYTARFIWYNIFYNVLLSGLRSNVFISSRGQSFGYRVHQYGMIPNSCNCRRDDTCVHPAYIYNDTGRIGIDRTATFSTLDNDSHVLSILPNLKVGCFPYKSLLSSTFQCFYNQSCLDSLQQYVRTFSFVSPLKSSRYAPETLIDDLLNNLLIESWGEMYNFSRYYEICSPKSCTYSYDRAFNVLLIVTTIISLFGGLKVILYYATPYIVRFLRRIHRFFFRRSQITNIETNANQRENAFAKTRLSNFYGNVRQQIRTYNMFPLARDGIFATRVYILLLAVGVIVLLFYSSISTQIHSIRIEKPTFDIYSKLSETYSTTLTCPCSKISIKHSSIINISSTLHQVCSSDFIQADKWLSYGSSLVGDILVIDFRVAGIGMFRILQKMCQLSTETLRNKLAVFNNVDLFTAEVLTNDVFDAQIASIIEEFQQSTVASFLDLYKHVQASIRVNHFMIPSSFDTGFLIYRTTSDEQMFFWTLKSYNNYTCSCALNDLCTVSIGIYCAGSTCSPNETVYLSEVPEWVLSCSPMDSLLLSSLACFYNSSCVQLLIDGYSFGMPGYQIDPRAANVTPLNLSLKSRFTPMTKLDQIVSELFIEEWIYSTSFQEYFRQCSPNECIYTYQERFSVSYIIATISGIVGGLSVALRILVPLSVTSIRRIFLCSCFFKKQTEEVKENSQQTRFTAIIQFRNKLQQMNLYRQIQENNDVLLIKKQLTATRLYIILFFISIGTILTYLNLETQMNSITISLPSLSKFEELKKKYSSTLTCSCSNIAISHSSFLSLQVSAYHQICSSQFISLDFFTSLWGIEQGMEYGINYDRKILSSLFRILSTMCTLTKSTVEQNIARFSKKQMISLKTLTRHSFQNQIDSLIESFMVEISADFRWIHNYITDMFHGNQLQHKFNLNWQFYRTDAGNNYAVRSFPVSFNESGRSCLCTTSPSQCFRSRIVSYDKTIEIPGIVFGCLPIDGLRRSTLQCLYNSTCLNQVASFFNMTSFPNALNQSIPSRFNPISSIKIGHLIDELFVETWQTSSNYSNYYSTCAPSSCEYSYVARNSIIHVITRFLGLYGGLTVGLKLFAWYFLKVYWIMRRYIDHCDRRNEVVSFNSS